MGQHPNPLTSTYMFLLGTHTWVLCIFVFNITHTDLHHRDVLKTCMHDLERHVNTFSTGLPNLNYSLFKLGRSKMFKLGRSEVFKLGRSKMLKLGRSKINLLVWPNFTIRPI